MATVQQFFDNQLSYDLRDFGGQDYDYVQRLLYLNRAVKILDDELFSIGSDWTANTENVTLDSGNFSMTAPTGCANVRTIYIDQTEKRELNWNDLHRRRTVWGSSSTGEPYYWSQRGTSIEWDLTSDQAYTCLTVFDKWTGTLALTNDMPYSDNFNDYLVQATAIIAGSAKKDQGKPADIQIHQLFKQILHREDISRQFRKKYYHMDF